jgi:moderate conductance mechanosensitive channel
MAWGTVAAQAPVEDADLIDACGDDPGLLCEWVYDQTGNSVLARLAEWLVSKPLYALVVLLVAFIARYFVHRAIDRLARHIVAINEVDADADDQTSPAILAARTTTDAFHHIAGGSERVRQRALTLASVLRSVATGIIFVIAGLMILGQFEINIVPLLAGAGIAGIAIGFGAQSLVKDFLTGIFMLAEDQFGVGDVVDVGEATGTVERLGLRSTRLRDVEGTVWHVPNGEITRVGNMSQLWARTILDVEVAYDSDLEEDIRVIKEVADQLWREQREDAPILEEPEVWGVESVTAASMAIRLAVKTKPSEQWRTARMLRIRLKEAFDREGIAVPFPQQALWVRSDPWVPGRPADPTEPNPDVQH